MIETRLLRIRPPDAGSVPLGVTEKRTRTLDGRLPPVLLVHGATFGQALFDLPRAGYSLMGDMAIKGRAVYGLDIRGYGHSLGGAIMDEPPARNAPFAGVDAAVDDIDAAVDFVLARQGVAAVDLIGFSWGAITAARYAGAHPQKIARLALYAPLYGEMNVGWLERISDAGDRGRLKPTFGAYRLITLADLVGRWNGELPTDNPALYREDGIPELVFSTFAALDPLANSRTPPAFRCPNGALGDLLRVFNGQPIYDPEKLTMPTLLLRGADDTTSTGSDCLGLLARIASPMKDYRVIAPGSHFLCIERNRAKLYDELNQFLGPDQPAIQYG